MDSIKAIVLAAGKGTRLHSAEHNQPKALREAAGKPLLHYVLSNRSHILYQSAFVYGTDLLH